MPVCKSCGNPVPDEAKFCPVCGTPVNVETSVDAEISPVTEAPAAKEPVAPAVSWYESAAQNEASIPVSPASVSAKPAIGKIWDFYLQALEVLKKKPIRLWGISLLYLVIAYLISALGALVPIISVPIVLVLSLGFTGVILKGLHGEDVRSEQLFQSFRKDVVARNAGGMCWMELWSLIWAFVPVMNIIKFYSYCLTPYILLTDKEIGPTDALKKSMRMTDGYKGKMFGADILIAVAVWVVFLVLILFSEIPYVGWLFAIVLVLAYLALVLFLPLFLNLVHAAIFEAINAVHKE